MKKVLSLALIFMLLFGMTAVVPAFADEEFTTTVSRAGKSVNANDYVNIILTDKNSAVANAASIKYINQVKPDSDGKWSIKFQIKGALEDYKILFRQNNTVSDEISPEYIASATQGLSAVLSASVAARTVVANYNIKNEELVDVTCKVYVISYDINGNLIDAYAPDVDISGTEQEIADEIIHEIPSDADHVKVFCWYDMKPLTKPEIVFPAGDYVKNRGSLGNVFTKLNNGEDATIVYLGGSVTWGSGASNKDETSWRALTTQWFKDNYPNANIISKNSAQGSTGSFWGSIRVEKDVLSYNPDLVFVMCTINDVYETMTKEDTQRQMEEIIRKIRAYDDETDIVIGYDTDKTTGSSRELYDMVKWHEEVAMEYDISSMDMGRCLANAVLDGETTWEDSLADSVHPNDVGYEYYADVAISLLEEGKSNAPETLNVYTVPADRKFGKPMNTVLYKAAENFALDATPADRSGSELYTKQYVLEPGQSLSLAITGNRFGIYGKGDFSFSTEDKSPMRITYNIGNVCRFWWYDIGNGEHDITVTNNSAEETAYVYGVFAWDR